MKPKTARRFLSKNQWALAAEKDMPPSFFKRVEKAKEVLKGEKRK